jgi:hypothetical protein
MRKGPKRLIVIFPYDSSEFSGSGKIPLPILGEIPQALEDLGYNLRVPKRYR